MSTIAILTVPNVAARLGLTEWQVRRLFARGEVPQPPRAGLTRLITEDSLPAIVAAAKRVGYLPAETASAV